MVTSMPFYKFITSSGITLIKSELSISCSSKVSCLLKCSTVASRITSGFLVQFLSLFPYRSLLVLFFFIFTLTFVWTYWVFLSPSRIYLSLAFSFQNISSWISACWYNACGLFSSMLFSTIQLATRTGSWAMSLSSVSLTYWKTLPKTFLFHHVKEFSSTWFWELVTQEVS